MARPRPQRTTDTDSLPQATVYELLSNKRRQYVVEYVTTEERASDFGDVVDYVAARENGVPSAQLQSDQRKNVYTALRQAHLPKLDDAGVVDFDHQRGSVARGDNADLAREYLAFSPGRERAYSYSYLGLAVIGIGITSLHGAGAPLIDTIPTIVLIALICFLFGFLATLHVYTVSEGLDIRSVVDIA